MPRRSQQPPNVTPLNAPWDIEATAAPIEALHEVQQRARMGEGVERVRLVPIDSLHLSNWNPRSVTPERLDNLCQAILADPSFLWSRPVCARADGEIYAGHQRWRAVQRNWDRGGSAWRVVAADAGIEPNTIPATVGDVSERVAKERAIRDNNTWGSFDDNLLLLHMQELANTGSDLTLLGYDDEALKAFRPAGEEGEGEGEGDEEGELATPPVPITRPGDVWTLGRHRLGCLDATDLAAVQGMMLNQTADALISDPPYGMDLDTNYSDMQGKLGSTDGSTTSQGNVYPKIVGDGGPFDATPIFKAFPNVKEMFLFGADYYVDTIPVFGRDGSWLVWDKRKESQAEAIGAEFEMIWSKRLHKRRVLRHDWFGFLSSENSLEARARCHPTQKPSSLIRDILAQWVPEEGLVVDLYAGSGTTLIACEQTGRRCVALELEPHYCDVILARWTAFTHLDAVRGDGRTWSELNA